MAETHQISLPMESIPQDPPPLEESPQTLPTVQPQRTALVEETQQKMPVGKQRRGRQKIPMQWIQNNIDRLITFSRRRAGIYKKATEISTLCSADVGILIFSPAGKPFAYGLPNIESISDRFLRGVDREAQNDNVSRIVTEAQRREHVGKLNKDCDELSVYLQNLKKEGMRLMELKRLTFDGGCWWDIPVEDLKVDEMLVMTGAMEEIKKNASRRLKDLRVGASSSSAVVQPEDIKMGENVGFGYVGDGVFGEFTAGGSWSLLAGVQGGAMQMGGNLGQGYGGGAGDSGVFGDWRAGGSTAVGIQDGGDQVDGNKGLGGYGGSVGGLGYQVASSFVQAGGMQMGGNGGNGYGGDMGDFTAGGSSSESIQQDGMQIGEYEGGGFGGCDVAGGGVGLLRPVGLAAASSAVQPGGGSMLVGGNGGGSYGGGVASGGGLSDGWKPVNSPSTFTSILGVNPLQMAGNGGFGNFGGGDGVADGCVGGSGLGDLGEVGSASMQMGGNGGFGDNDNVGGSSAGGSVGGGGLSDWRAVGLSTMQMGGIRGFGYNNDARGGGSGEFGGGGAGGSGEFGGGGGFGDFTAGGSSAAALHQDQMGGTSNGGSFYDGGGEFGTNNGFGAFLCDGGREF